MTARLTRPSTTVQHVLRPGAPYRSSTPRRRRRASMRDPGPARHRADARADEDQPARTSRVLMEENAPTDHEEIRSLIERWATAVHEGDLDTVLDRHAVD